MKDRNCDRQPEAAAAVAPLDSLCLDIFSRHTPERVAALRDIETTEPTPAPPLVASPDADPDECARLARALVSAHEDAALRQALDHALVEKFVTVAPDLDGRYGRASTRSVSPSP